jgi:hypothetical protein
VPLVHLLCQLKTLTRHLVLGLTSFLLLEANVVLVDPMRITVFDDIFPSTAHSVYIEVRHWNILV